MALIAVLVGLIFVVSGGIQTYKAVTDMQLLHAYAAGIQGVLWFILAVIADGRRK